MFYTVTMSKHGEYVGDCNAENMTDAFYDSHAMMRRGTIDTAVIMLNGEIVRTVRTRQAELHATGQVNALGTIIGCDCERCAAVVAEIERENFGHKIQAV